MPTLLHRVDGKKLHSCKTHLEYCPGSTAQEGHWPVEASPQVRHKDDERDRELLVWGKDDGFSIEIVQPGKEKVLSLNEAFQYLKGLYKKLGERLFTRAWSNRAEGNWFKLKEDMFKEWWGSGTGCLEKLWALSKGSRSGWRGLSATCSSGRCPCGVRVETRQSVRGFPKQGILWFYEELTHFTQSLHTKTVACFRMISLQKNMRC